MLTILAVVAFVAIVSEIPFLLHPFVPGSIGDLARELALSLAEHAGRVVDRVREGAWTIVDLAVSLLFLAIGLMTLCPLLAVAAGMWLYRLAFGR